MDLYNALALLLVTGCRFCLPQLPLFENAAGHRADGAGRWWLRWRWWAWPTGFKCGPCWIANSWTNMDFSAL